MVSNWTVLERDGERDEYWEENASDNDDVNASVIGVLLVIDFDIDLYKDIARGLIKSL